ncbi:Clp protease N-terminal domain-containing protein [Nocardiopsis algeriensis]
MGFGHLTQAYTEALQSRHNVLGPEHLLLGALHDERRAVPVHP